MRGYLTEYFEICRLPINSLCRCAVTQDQRFCIQSISAGAQLSAEAHSVFLPGPFSVLSMAKCHHSQWPAWNNSKGLGRKEVGNIHVGNT